MGDADKEPSEEDIDASQEKRSEAMAAMADGDIQKAVDFFTEAIKLNPGKSLILYIPVDFVFFTVLYICLVMRKVQLYEAMLFQNLQLKIDIKIWMAKYKCSGTL